MNITWLTFADLTIVDGQATSNVSNARYRVLTPARELRRLGQRLNLVTVNDPESAELRAALEADIVVFSRSLQIANEGLARYAQSKGAKVVFDICDNLFAKPELGEHYRAMVNLADGIVANSHEMSGVIAQHTGRHADVIGDPVEGPHGTPQFTYTSPPLKVLWFGHQLNFDSFVNAIPYLNAAAPTVPMSVTTLTGPIDGIEQTFADFNERTAFPIKLHYRPWSLTATWDALRDTDIVLLPHAPSPERATKSANRLIESIWAGRFVVAQPVRAYEEFQHFAWIGDDLAEGIHWAATHQQECWTRIAQGQRVVAEHYTPSIIAREWLRFFAELRRGNVPRDATTTTSSQGLRLNLGCGARTIPGYVNVDLANERAGVKPDVSCDIRQLHQFADNSVDEILSIHVIEHFWRWEVVDVLREWTRVLKPGGEMIIECSNLLAACTDFVNDPNRFSSDGPEGETTMWVLYGDPRWRDPLMVHRWGYTPHSLALVMKEAGIDNVRQEPAQFNFREPRDMRLVGEKLHPTLPTT